MPLNLSDIQPPKVSIGEVDGLGELFVGEATMGLYTRVERSQLTVETPTAQLVNLLIECMVTRADGVPLTSDEIDALSAVDRQRIVAAIGKAHPNWFKQQHDDKSSEIVQEEGESDEAYLARCFLLDKKREFGRMALAMAGLSERMTSIIGPGLTANRLASSRVAAALKAISLPEPSPQLPHFPPIQVPRNPIHETNDILTAVSRHIAHMSELSSATAAMQKTLNDTASAAVADFSRGAESSQRNAKWSLVVALIALAISVLTGVGQWWQSLDQDRAENLRTEKLIASQQALIEALRQQKSTQTPGQATTKARPEGLLVDRSAPQSKSKER